jgi:hypothetical protein
MEAAILIIGLVLVLMAFAPVAPVAPSNRTRTGLRTRIARHLYLWDRYLLGLHGGGLWRE